MIIVYVRVCASVSVCHIVKMPYIVLACWQLKRNETKAELSSVWDICKFIWPERKGTKGSSCPDVAAAHGEPYWLDKAHRHEPTESEPEVQTAPLPCLPFPMHRKCETCEILKQISIVFDMCDIRLNARIIGMHGLACVCVLDCLYVCVCSCVFELSLC